MPDNKLMLIGEHTYGYYYPDTNTFSCSHGGWDSEVEIINETECRFKSNVINSDVRQYLFIDEIPKEYVV